MTDLAERLHAVRTRIDQRLVAYLKDKLAEVTATSPDSVELAEASRTSRCAAASGCVPSCSTRPTAR
ncbi:MAG: hypothetical protein H6722_10460 [Sandaracinus sp.]|nr:hypothetical protein [Sandaracinus sp.]